MNTEPSETKQKLVWSALFLGAVVLGSLLVWRGFGEQTKTEERRRSSDLSPIPILGVFGPAPEFSLTERSGQKFSKVNLAGKLWIADFIFTNCPGQCPMMSANMKRLQTLFPKETGLQLISFTVDPDRDTPEVLSGYADRYEAEKNRWFFLTGTKEEINRVLTGFFLSEVGEPFMHSTRFILVDPAGRVRGYYDSEEPEKMSALIRDAKTLLQTGRGQTPSAQKGSDPF